MRYVWLGFAIYFAVASLGGESYLGFLALGCGFLSGRAFARHKDPK